MRVHRMPMKPESGAEANSCKPVVAEAYLWTFLSLLAITLAMHRLKLHVVGN